MYKKGRKKFFNSLNLSAVSDNRKFWKTVKPLFSNKGNRNKTIKLVQKEEIIDDTKVAELNNFLKTAVTSLDFHGNQHTVENVENIGDPADKIIKNFNFIKKKLISSKHFTYQFRLSKNISKFILF